MKVINTYIIEPENGVPKILFECAGNAWFISTNGGFGQRETYWERIRPHQAKKLIKPTSPQQ